MAEKIEKDDGTSEVRENSKSAITPDERTTSVESDNITQNQETGNMEIHKHLHHVTHKKKWDEYILEFLMLFLAVFLGFLTENFREHEIEKERAKQYIQSF